MFISTNKKRIRRNEGILNKSFLFSFGIIDTVKRNKTIRPPLNSIIIKIGTQKSCPFSKKVKLIFHTKNKIVSKTFIGEEDERYFTLKMGNNEKIAIWYAFNWVEKIVSF